MPPCLTFSIMRYGSRVSGAIPGKKLHPLLHFGVVANEEGAFGPQSTTAGQFTLFLMQIICIVLSYSIELCAKNKNKKSLKKQLHKKVNVNVQ